MYPSINCRDTDSNRAGETVYVNRQDWLSLAVSIKYVSIACCVYDLSV